MTTQEAATLLYAAFVSDTRDDGATFYKLADGSPEWMTNAIHAAHDAVDELPDDEVYAACRSAAEFIADRDDAEDGDHEFADGEVDVYNAGRVQWVAAKPLIRGPLCDEAGDDLGFTFTGQHGGDFFSLIALGWYEWARRIYSAILEGCREAAESEEDETEDEG